MTSNPTWSGRHTGKDTLRQHIWSTLKIHNATHRDPVGHIPNFIGANLAAARLAETDLWRQAKVIKCNPDSPQMPVRLRALADEKILYMAVPQLSRKQCFVALTAAALKSKGVAMQTAATMGGAMRHGQLVAFDVMKPIDLIVVGCVAAATNGGRVGKGAGFADLELAMLRECGLISEATPIVTTVHELQIVDAAALPMQAHDWGLDLVATPTQCWTTHHRHLKPEGLDWDALQPEQITKIPILQDWLKQRQ